MLIDPSELDRRSAYRLLTSIIVPRPIAWVGSRSSQGVDNLAPFSFFNGVSTHPPVVSISVARGRNGVLKDTARNILDTGVFSISIVDIHSLESMHQSSGGFRSDLSEFERVGVEPEECKRVAVPRVASAPATLECRLNRALDLDTTHLVLGDVVAVHVRDELYKDGAVDPSALSVVARLGGAYSTLGEVRVLPPPFVPEEEGR